MKFSHLIFLVITLQIAHSSSKKQEWVLNINAESFVPGLLLQQIPGLLQQKNKEKETEKKIKKISLAEQILDDGAVKNNDMITKYLSNADLYFLLQVSKIISNAARGFMKKREKEHKEKEQKLKEHFLYDFNAFIDYARIASLDYLEIEIPEKVLNNLVMAGICNRCPSMWIERSYYNKAKPPKIFVIGFESDDDLATLHNKQYRLKENETLKFKFHFQQCQNVRENHHVTFFGQTFEFQDFTFTLFRPGGKYFKFKADSYFPDFFASKYLYKKQNSFKSNPKDRVRMVEETGLKFKFKFHISETDNYYPFDKPIYNYANLFPNFKNYFSSTKQKYDMLKNSNVLNPKSDNLDKYLNGIEQIYDPNFGQQQYPFYQLNNNFGQF
jgi:hypothetical protein